jgi:hypothetical protein
MELKPDILCIFSHTNWVAEDFRSGIREAQLEQNYTLIHSLGLDVPREVYQADIAGENVSYWVPSFLAAQLQRLNIAQALTSPGDSFMSDIPEELSGRKIVTTSLKNFLSTETKASSLFIKPAEAKLDYFVAGSYTLSDIEKLAQQYSIPDSTMVQYTDSILELNYEHRLYIYDGLVLTGSAYLIDGSTYYDNMDNPLYQYKLPNAVAYAQDIIDTISNKPMAFTLDVAWNIKTQSWFVLEANPAWCSGIYGSDVESVIYTIQRSCNPITEQEKKFLWKPDQLLIDKAYIQPRLTVF